MPSQLWPLYPHFFLTSDANAIRRKNLARTYMQKIFANDRWVRQLTTLRCAYQQSHIFQNVSRQNTVGIKCTSCESGD